MSVIAICKAEQRNGAGEAGWLDVLKCQMDQGSEQYYREQRVSVRETTLRFLSYNVSTVQRKTEVGCVMYIPTLKGAVSDVSKGSVQ